MRISEVLAGYLKLDGGGMFGVVPKRMWNKLNPSNENNLTPWAMRSLLIEYNNRKILVDTGIGNKQSDKFRSHFEPYGPSAVESLREIQLDAEEITDVFLTHFHFDHVGGALQFDTSGKIVPTYPNATYWTNEVHYKWADQSNPREAASFLQENFYELKRQNKIKYIDIQKDDVEWLPGLSVRMLYGHTEAMMMLFIDTPDGTRYAYATDLIPSRWHIRLAYVLSYDLRPLVTMEERKRLLDECIEQNRTLILEHDPGLATCQLYKDERGRYQYTALDGSLPNS